jgi:protein TonB
MRIALGLTAVTDGDASDVPREARASTDWLSARLLVPARPRRRYAPVVVSGVAHVGALFALILVPLFAPGPALVSRDFIRVLIYDPPPPPAPPLPRGNPLLREAARPRPPRAEPRPEPAVRTEEPVLVAPIEPSPATVDSGATRARAEAEQAGTPAGSDLGVPEGMEEGVEGGQIGGVPGGVLGGVIGGTGRGPVLDYDAPPRILRQTRPRYPQEAFVKKVEGTVVVEFVIDATGRVGRARVVQSIPLLDAAAVEVVGEWLFAPAVKHGLPVATVARAPVVFRIF